MLRQVVRVARFSTAGPAAAGKQLPRKSAATVVKKTPMGAMVTAGVLGACGAGLAYTLYDKKMTLVELYAHWKDSFMSRFRDAADPDFAFMQNALPPAPPCPPDFDIPTIFVCMEGVLLCKEWDRKYGTRYVKRPGVEALLLGLTKQGFEIVFWSEASMGTAEEPLVKLVTNLPGQASIGGVLGREHMFFRNNKGEKRIDSLPRPMSNMLIIDYDRKTYENQPENTILVPKMNDFDEKDTTLYTILTLATMYRDERNRRRVSDIRSFVKSISDGAGSAAADPTQLLESFQKMATERRLKREEEMKSGLGGLIRSAQSTSVTLKQGKAVTPSTSSGNLKIADNSLMAQQRDKMRERMMKSQNPEQPPQ